MTYVFRWRCREQAVEIQVTVTATTDKAAGELAAACLHDFARGRARQLHWEPLMPMLAPELDG